jgi:protease YdgD
MPRLPKPMPPLRRALSLVAAGAVLCGSGPVQAEQSGLRRLSTGDDSRGWEAVGRLNFGHEAFCTGALIAPNLVLTAAHCLYSKTTGQMVDPKDVEFLAGWRDGRAAAYRGAKRVIVDADYDYGNTDKMARVASDLGLIELDQPIRLPSLQPLPLGEDPFKGEEVGVVSYAHDRSEAPSLQSLCTVLNRAGGVALMSCAADFGTSGAPVFAQRDGHPEIVAVVSAKAELDGQPVSLGAGVGPVAALRARLETARGGVSAGRSRDTGAKFLRP